MDSYTKQLNIQAMFSSAMNEQALVNQAIESLHFMQRRVTIPLSDDVQALLTKAEDLKYDADRRVRVIQWACCHETVTVLLPDGSYYENAWLDYNFEMLALHNDPLFSLRATVHYVGLDGKFHTMQWNVAGLMDAAADKSAIPTDDCPLEVIAIDKQLVAG